MRAALLLSTVLVLIGCSKDPGDGGRAEIRGVVLMQNVSLSGNPVDDPFPAVDERVYIIYGDGQYFDDDTRTGPNGEFRFPWLRKGSYRIYAVSECDNEGCREGVFQAAKIDGRRDIVNVPTITVLRY